MSKVIVVISALSCLLSTAFAWGADWQSSPTDSHLYFAPSYEGMPINGHFKQFSVRYQTDQQSQPSRLKVKVAIASADMGNSDINEAIGTLQLKGFSQPVTVPVSWQPLPDGKAKMTGELLVGRNDFSIGSGEWASGEQIGLAVKIWFDVVFIASEID
jgi:polyisoprenoid-binding protein YceI